MRLLSTGRGRALFGVSGRFRNISATAHVRNYVHMYKSFMCTDFFITDEIIKSTDNAKIEVHHLDLTSLASIRKFADNIIDNEPRVDILINNAGATGLGNKQTADNLQIGMQVNYFGPFLLTCLLVGKSLAMGTINHSRMWDQRNNKHVRIF
jgi:NAD(P)-dependent dehydrogenase (short-subunit alcohol dehydrogenase family)